MMKVLYSAQDKMLDEIKEICAKGGLTSEDIKLLGEMVDIIKDVTTVDAMHEAKINGYSGDYMRNYSQGYPYEYANVMGSRYYYDNRRGRDGDGDGRYSERRDPMTGRYMSRDGSYDDRYSGHTNNEMIMHLTDAMRNAKTEEERENYRRTIEQLNR